MPRYQETVSYKERELDGAKIDPIRVGIKSAEQDKQEIVEPFDFGRMAGPQRVLNGKRVYSELSEQSLVVAA
jgi:hypothetical protein